jgi:hypothetical protein
MERRRIIFAQGLLQLVDQGGSLLDQFDLIPTEQTQLLHQGIQRGQRSPALPVGAEAIGKTPSIQRVCLGAAGSLALPVGLGALAVHGKNRRSAFQ